jgi:phosphatidylglycerol---prolipoprotein diacylglyceryl transferase
MTDYFFWDPNRILFTLPFIERPVLWYGFFFVLGFIFAYLIAILLFRQLLQSNPKAKEPKDLSMLLADRLSWFAILGTVIGARLGEVFFYNWDYYKAYPERIIRIWEGGLASHGGVIGVVLALTLYYRFYLKKRAPQIGFLTLLDLCAIPAALLSTCIRVGNFFNQEIIGTETSMPWAVIFGHSADGSAPVPRHPVQLYEALCYLAIFIFLGALWKYKESWRKPGMTVGLLFILVFGSRFLLEFFKAPMEASITQSYLQMGQLLSLPFVAIGILLLLSPRLKKV